MPETVEGQATTPLHIAALNGRVERARYLLDKGANPKALTRPHDLLDTNNDRARHEAFERGQIDTVYPLSWFSAQPVHFAAISGSVDLVKLLIARGVDMSSACSAIQKHSDERTVRWTLLDFATHRGNYELFDYLTHDEGVLKEGIDLNIPTDPENDTLIELLLNGCACQLKSINASPPHPQYKEILSTILATDNIKLLDNAYFSGPILAQAPWPDGTTLLKMLMDKMGLLDRAPEIWREDATISDENRQRLRDNFDGALHSQVIFSRQKDLVTNISLLLSCGADLNSHLYAFHEYVTSGPFTTAAGIRFLVSHGANINALDVNGRTPLFLKLRTAIDEAAAYWGYQGRPGELCMKHMVEEKDRTHIIELLQSVILQ